MEKQNRDVVSPHELDQNMKINSVVTDGLTWYSPLEEPFRISGLAWMKEDRVYRRLPVAPDYPIPAPVDRLADCTSGGQIHFRTNSSSITVRVSLAAGSSMYHMPATGECGMDVYYGGPGSWLFAGTASFQPGIEEYESRLFQCNNNEMRSFILNMPLYRGVKEIWIGVEPDAEVLPPDAYDSDKRIIVYGTSITQGGCAARPGMSYTNILSRRIHQEFINLGFSGNGKGEPELAHLITQIDNPECFIIDYEANSGGTEPYRKSLPVFIEILREAYPNVPIILVSRFPYAAEAFKPELLQERLERRDFQIELVEKLKEAGDQRLTFVDGASLISSRTDEATVDGVHPTDFGFMQMADNLEPVLRRVLEGK
ncbi:SGNH/GDSL hydrolase family protein [Paenibacillus dakarensis]|uniref:SGNH/GDSL hydrolase family protein n=1 Tax=Paenibacillus dakarensis TaxID=1527293 RepID=UPI001FE0F70C|nr:SGNH/GDSL hydrolase family protein [Paenibacillus dakarensis]